MTTAGNDQKRDFFDILCVIWLFVEWKMMINSWFKEKLIMTQCKKSKKKSKWTIPTLKTNDVRLSNSDNLPSSEWSSRNSIGLVQLNTNDVDASLNISPGTILWIPNTSTKYFLSGINPASVCLLRIPVQARAVPRFESMRKEIFHSFLLLSWM